MNFTKSNISASLNVLQKDFLPLIEEFHEILAANVDVFVNFHNTLLHSTKIEPGQQWLDLSDALISSEVNINKMKRLNFSVDKIQTIMCDPTRSREIIRSLFRPNISGLNKICNDTKLMILSGLAKLFANLAGILKNTGELGKLSKVFMNFKENIANVSISDAVSSIYDIGQIIDDLQIVLTSIRSLKTVSQPIVDDLFFRIEDLFVDIPEIKKFLLNEIKLHQEVVDSLLNSTLHLGSIFNSENQFSKDSLCDSNELGKLLNVSQEESDVTITDISNSLCQIPITKLTFIFEKVIKHINIKTIVKHYMEMNIERIMADSNLTIAEVSKTAEALQSIEDIIPDPKKPNGEYYKHSQVKFKTIDSRDNGDANDGLRIRDRDVAPQPRPWDWETTNRFQTTDVPFTGREEILVQRPDSPQPIDFFSLYLPDDIIKHCTTETNRYADRTANCVTMKLSEALEAAGSVMCGNPLEVLKDKLALLDDGKGNSINIKKSELESLPTEYCQNLYRQIVKLSGGPVIWGFLKPIMQGRILYTPNSPATRLIIQNANSTFNLIGQYASILKKWSKGVTSIDYFKKSKSSIKELESILKSDLFKDLLLKFFNQKDTSDNAKFLSMFNMTHLLDDLGDSQALSKLVILASNITECFNSNRFHGYDSEEEIVKATRKFGENGQFLASIVFLNMANEQNRVKRSDSFPSIINPPYSV
ncbi:ATP-binding cassette sub-family A member 13 [Nymphon striatum]|nr:ATP-binding cassette sub-family A member 13 [Nymphon striatum]